MDKLGKLLAQYRAANEAFWTTHDRLVRQGFSSKAMLTNHPDYIAADKNVSAASQRFAAAQRKAAE